MYPENTALSREFSLKSLLSFSMPTICMMVFMSLYTSVDGIFVSHYISSNALAAVNLVYPVFSFALARARRDFTVPSATPRAWAISW